MIAIKYASATGEIVAICTHLGPSSAYQAEDGFATLVADDANLTDAYIEGQEVRFKPSRPSSAHRWNWGTKTWDLHMTDACAQAWERIKRARWANEFGPFTWSGHTFDGDSESQRRIQGAGQLAALAMQTNQPWSVDWTLADNTTLSVSAADMTGVGGALAVKVAGAHATARVLRAQIEAATTLAQLEAIQWPV